MKILYLNHTGQMSGAERSLLELVDALPEEIEASVGSPEGPLADAVRARGVDFHPIRGTDGSLKLHPLHTTRTLAELAAAAVSVRRFCAAHGVQLVHANSIRASLVACGASALGGPPVVAHVRDCLPPGRVSGMVGRLIRARAGRVVANSRYTLERFGAGAGGAVIHNSADPRRFHPGARNGKRPGFALGVVAQLTPWKGQDDAIRALALVRERHPDVRLVLAGSAKFVRDQTRFDNREYVRRLEALVDELGLGDRVEFAGECDDVTHIYRALDVVLVPSWEEPFGRTVIEAMAMGVPVVATDVGGPPEIVEHRRSGLLVRPRSPKEWAHAICELIESPELRARLAGEGPRTVEARFTPEHHAAAMARIYAQLLEAEPNEIRTNPAHNGSSGTLGSTQ